MSIPRRLKERTHKGDLQNIVALSDDMFAASKCNIATALSRDYEVGGIIDVDDEHTR
jgi:hypothetical protein